MSNLCCSKKGRLLNFMVTLFLILFACIIAIFSSALYVPIFVKKAQAKKGIMDDAKPERLYALLSKISCLAYCSILYNLP